LQLYTYISVLYVEHYVCTVGAEVAYLSTPSWPPPEH
jgi:hypothetical protein